MWIDTSGRMQFRDQTRYSRHGSSAACAGIQIQSAAEIGKSDRSFSPFPRFSLTLSLSLLPCSLGRFALSVLSTISYIGRLLFAAASAIRLAALRYKYLPIISRHTGQYHTSVRCGPTTEKFHPLRCVLSRPKRIGRRFSLRDSYEEREREGRERIIVT